MKKVKGFFKAAKDRLVVGGSAVLGAAAAGNAFAFETGLADVQDTVNAIIGIGVAITVALVTFTVGRRAARGI